MDGITARVHGVRIKGTVRGQRRDAVGIQISTEQAQQPNTVAPERGRLSINHCHTLLARRSVCGGGIGSGARGLGINITRCGFPWLPRTRYGTSKTRPLNGYHMRLVAYDSRVSCGGP